MIFLLFSCSLNFLSKSAYFKQKSNIQYKEDVIINNQIQTKYKKINSQINEIEKQLTTYPKGKLICSHNGKYTTWYLKEDNTITHLPKKNRPLAEKLAYKKYLTCQLQDLEKEQTALNFYLRHHSTGPSKVERLLSDTSYRELLVPHFMPQDQTLSEWMNSPYKTSHQYPEQLTIKTSLNTYVRSKSEAMIHMYLLTNQIPFRYECALELENITLYPDFTIRHPNTGETYYWEHFGLMNDSKYAQNAFSKQQLCASHGIIPTLNLITTYETSEHPLNPSTIQTIIDQYFHS